jgi:UDP-N-acetylmuramoyl-L-alanyl-D-glutamate--2,6-diaminopimelate ligase
MEKVPLKNCDFSLFIDYAHTPDAIEKLLLSARSFRQEGGRIIILFGCGGERDRDKRKKMAQIASGLADLVIITSDNSRSEDTRQIFADIMKGIDKEKPYVLIEDRAEAIKYALTYARARDIVLLAGKGHEKYEIDRAGRHFFD